MTMWLMLQLAAEAVQHSDALMLALTGANGAGLVGHAFMAMKAFGRMEATLSAVEGRVKRIEELQDAQLVAKL